MLRRPRPKRAVHAARKKPDESEVKDSSGAAPEAASGAAREYDLEIRPLSTAKHNIPQRPLMEQNVIPRHPSSVIFNGSSNSGKTTLLLTLLTRDDFLKDYFDEIHVFSPTGGSDDLYEHLDIPKKNIHVELDVDDLEEIMEKQE